MLGIFKILSKFVNTAFYFITLWKSITQKSSVSFNLTSELPTNTSLGWKLVSFPGGNLVMCIKCVHKYVFLKMCITWLNNYISKEFTSENNWNLPWGNNLSSGNNWKVCKNGHHSVVYNTKILDYDYQSIGITKITYSLSTMDLLCRSVVYWHRKVSVI